jgi:hypothetical protein
MSRLAKENPDLNEQELEDLAMRGTPKKIAEGETRYDFTCYKCGDTYSVNQETHDWIESLERSPKCSNCYL